jgi:hypothetical protein
MVYQYFSPGNDKFPERESSYHPQPSMSRTIRRWLSWQFQGVPDAIPENLPPVPKFLAVHRRSPIGVDRHFVFSGRPGGGTAGDFRDRPAVHLRRGRERGGWRRRFRTLGREARQGIGRRPRDARHFQGRCLRGNCGLRGEITGLPQQRRTAREWRAPDDGHDELRQQHSRRDLQDQLHAFPPRHAYVRSDAGSSALLRPAK